MTDAPNAKLVLSIEHDQRIDLNADGTAVRGYETYIREYVGMLESGLMARLSNAAYKTLHALALRARILGDPRKPGAEEEFEELVRLGIVSKEDKGHLFCFPSRERLMQDTGMGSVHTVDAAVDELANAKIVKRITPTQPRLMRGLFGSNVYIIHPESFIGKFGTPDGEQKLLPAAGTESSLRHSDNCLLKNKDSTTTTTTLFESAQIANLIDFYARTIGAKTYTPTEKEIRLLSTLLTEGFSVAQIENGIACAVEYARTKNRTTNLSFCARFVRHPLSEEYRIGSSDSKSSGEIVTANGKSSAQIVPVSESDSVRFEALSLDDAARVEFSDLIALIEEHSEQRLSRALLTRWKTLADEFQELAMTHHVTPLMLVRRAVEEALDAGSANKGFCAPKMARVILMRWAKESTKEARKKDRAPKREIPLGVQVYRQVRRRYPVQELWDTIDQTVGRDETDLNFWRDVLKAWVGRGYNPLNVSGPLEWFKRREIPKNGNAAPVIGGVSRQRPIETLDTIQARLRQNAPEQQDIMESSNQTQDAEK